MLTDKKLEASLKGAEVAVLVGSSEGSWELEGVITDIHTLGLFLGDSLGETRFIPWTSVISVYIQ